MTRSSRTRTRAVTGALLAALGAGMVLDTTFLSPEDAAAINPAEFDAAVYADEHFPEAVATITERATELTELAPALAADPAAAGEEYGTAVGSGKYAFAVAATGTVAEADPNFLTLQVPGLPPGTTVRVPVGAPVSGTPIRDAPGDILFSDFVDQTQFQSVANQFKTKVLEEVVADLDPASLQGQQVRVVGAWTTGGPAGTYNIQPVSIEPAA